MNLFFAKAKRKFIFLFWQYGASSFTNSSIAICNIFSFVKGERHMKATASFAGWRVWGICLFAQIQNWENFKQISVLDATMLCHCFCHFVGYEQFSQQRIFYSLPKPKSADQEQSIFCLLKDMCHFGMPDQSVENTNMPAYDQWNGIVPHDRFRKAKVFRGHKIDSQRNFYLKLPVSLLGSEAIPFLSSF